MPLFLKSFPNGADPHPFLRSGLRHNYVWNFCGCVKKEKLFLERILSLWFVGKSCTNKYGIVSQIYVKSVTLGIRVKKGRKEE